MARYAIGDIQGCFDSFQALLEKLPLNPKNDELWLAGDLVNRGPKSLEVLRWLGKTPLKVSWVLGNHDISLLACHFGVRPVSPEHRIEPILQASDREVLIQLIQNGVFIHSDDKWLMVHAGLLPRWSLKFSQKLARKIEEELKGPNVKSFLTQVFQKPRITWADAKNEREKLVAGLNILTRIRICTKEGNCDFNFTGTLNEIPKGYLPWFECRKVAKKQIVFGHWSALGFHKSKVGVGIDTGCVWGEGLTALCLDTGKSYYQPFIDLK